MALGGFYRGLGVVGNLPANEPRSAGGIQEPRGQPRHQFHRNPQPGPAIGAAGPGPVVCQSVGGGRHQRAGPLLSVRQRRVGDRADAGHSPSLAARCRGQNQARSRPAGWHIVPGRDGHQQDRASRAKKSGAVASTRSVAQARGPVRCRRARHSGSGRKQDPDPVAGFIRAGKGERGTHDSARGIS